MRLNHLTLTVPRVAELTDFFERCFGFRTIFNRGADKFVLLRGEDGFILNLNHKEDATNPGMFHVGFLVPGKDAVVAACERMIAAGYAPPEPGPVHGSFGFYYQAPGGVLVEVSATQTN